MNGYERILRHLTGKPVDRLPVMPITMQYAADAIGVPYRRYLSDHRVLVEAQIAVAERFDLDHVSCISDPAREAADCGARVEYFEDQPPAFVEEEALLADPSALSRLKAPDPLGGGRMTDRVEAVRRFREQVGGEKWIEGWVEGPCAQGADLRGINTLMLDFFDDPVFVKDLFAFIVAMELSFARAQVDAGADLIGIGDAAASLVGPSIYQEFILPFEKQLVDGIHAMGAAVRLHVCGNTRFAVPGFASLGCEVVDLDYPVPLDAARRQMGPNQILLGNLHPVEVLLKGTPDQVRKEVESCHAAAGPRYILGAGCEIPRGTPEESVRVFPEYAREHAP